jgi:uncharacterized membrane-anchored protein YhcB (DUF1043 family)
MSSIFDGLLASGDTRSLLLGMAGIIVGVAASLVTSRVLKRRLTAEQELAQKLFDYYRKKAQLDNLKRISSEIEMLTEKKSGMLDEYIRLVAQMTRQLEDAQKLLIVHALEQPSKKGRTQYLRRLAKEASQIAARASFH